MDINHLCPHCMREVKEQAENCPYCGKPLSMVNEVQHQLKPFTILAGKYIVGDVLGEGGFGITYIGVDINLELRVAIKEFYPNGYATRESNVTTELTAYAGQSMDIVYKWRDNFIKEARSLAKCAHLSGVVGVKDFFEENNTAYIILEYLEGKTLKEYVREQPGGKVTLSWLLPALEPVMTSLDAVHKEGLVHRDISPDNLMLLPDGKMKLLDFGAARDYTESGEKSLSVLLKPGYAPEEQYRSKGKQGPWSDVYALAGTIYKCITGITPPESMERMRQDEMQRPSALGVEILPQQEQALLHAMEVFAENRYQSVAEFHRDLYGTAMAQQTPVMAETAVTAKNTQMANTVRPQQPEGASSAGLGVQTWFQKNKTAVVAGIAGLAVVSVAAIAALGGRTEPAVEEQQVNVADNQQEDEQEEQQAALAQPEVKEETPIDEESVTTENMQLGKEQAFTDNAEIHRYEIIIQDATWEQAFQDCQNRGGYLVHINSLEEYFTIFDQIAQEGKKGYSFWLGACREFGSTQYQWKAADGGMVPGALNEIPECEGFWLDGEPSFAGEGTDEYFLQMIYRKDEDTYYWNDTVNDLLGIADYYSGKIGYICEYEDFPVNMSQEELEAEILRIREMWAVNRDAISNNLYDVFEPQPGVKIYSSANDRKMIEVKSNVLNEYNMTFQIENGMLTFAYYESENVQMRLYYKNGALIRLIKTDIGAEAVTHDLEYYNEEYCNIGQRAINDLNSIIG